MPTGGWKGLTRSDNSQAIAIAKVMQKFVNEGVEIIHLRFAHEVNYYQGLCSASSSLRQSDSLRYAEDGTYQGGVSDFKEGWAVVAAAIREHAPTVKMWFTPNVAPLAQYDEYFPDDPSTVDLIGIDYYPKVGDKTFLATMKPFHDKYASEKTKFAIGETGLGYGADMQARLAWLTDATSVETTQQMKHYVALSWVSLFAFRSPFLPTFGRFRARNALHSTAYEPSTDVSFSCSSITTKDTNSASPTFLETESLRIISPDRCRSSLATLSLLSCSSPRTFLPRSLPDRLEPILVKFHCPFFHDSLDCIALSAHSQVLAQLGSRIRSEDASEH